MKYITNYYDKKGKIIVSYGVYDNKNKDPENSYYLEILWNDEIISFVKNKKGTWQQIDNKKGKK